MLFFNVIFLEEEVSWKLYLPGFPLVFSSGFCGYKKEKTHLQFLKKKKTTTN